MSEKMVYKVVFVQSDGEKDLEWNEDWGDDGDLFLGLKLVCVVDFISNLLMKVNNGVVMGVVISQISDFSDVMMFMVSVSSVKCVVVVVVFGKVVVFVISVLL